MTTPRIDQDRLWRDLMTMGCMAALPGGGCDRLVLTDGDRDGRNLFVLWCQDAGLSVSIDAMGNIFARREGSDPSSPPVLAGSHLDTQSPGGKFDGVLGVLAALEAVRALNEAGITTKRPIEVVNWTNEEGARFSPGLMGSAVFAGLLDLETAHAATDRDGKTFGAELARIRYHGDQPMGGRPVYRYLELHIEQGSELEASGTTIATVTRSHWSAFATLECLGLNGHSQTTPMSRRRNALAGAARVIGEVERIGYEFEASGGRTSATTIDVWPNNRINIPHKALFSYVMVHGEEAGITAMRAQLDDAVKAIAAETGLTFNLVTDRCRAPIHFAPEMVELIEEVARDLGHSVARLTTLTGHDAFNLVDVCPTGLLFVPSRDGISHSELEYTSPEHCAAGAQVLLHAMLRSADRA